MFPSENLIVVVGMHRSGTSFLAGSLEASGLNLGPVATHNAHNAKGNRELQALNDFHNRALHARGYAWDRPPSSALDFTPEEAEELLGLLSNLPKPLGLKDPRMVLFWPGYRRLFPEARWVGIFRHPFQVARSLKERNGFKKKKSLQLWSTYNRYLMEAYVQQPFPLLNFDWPEEQLIESVNTLAQGMGLQQGGAGAFFTRELKHSGKAWPAQWFYPRLMALHRQLSKWSGVFK
jgi:hypothetical protein